MSESGSATSLLALPDSGVMLIQTSSYSRPNWILSSTLAQRLIQMSSKFEAKPNAYIIYDNVVPRPFATGLREMHA